MVGIVGILLLGSVAWSAVGALIGAIGAAGAALSTANNPPPVSLGTVIAVTPTLGAAATVEPTSVLSVDTLVPSPSPSAQPTLLAAATATLQAVATPQPVATATGVVAGRSPWILLPLPEPGAKVAAGAVTVQARGRGDAPIKAMHLEVDGATLQVALEQRSDSTWLGSANAKVTAGEHSVRATVTDANGRTGSFRWNFTAGSGP
jgi:hypothetical protein